MQNFDFFAALAGSFLHFPSFSGVRNYKYSSIAMLLEKIILESPHRRIDKKGNQCCSSLKLQLNLSKNTSFDFSSRSQLKTILLYVQIRLKTYWFRSLRQNTDSSERKQIKPFLTSINVVIHTRTSKCLQISFCSTRFNGKLSLCLVKSCPEMLKL